MSYDLGYWHWRGHGILHLYIVKLGRKLLNSRQHLQQLMAEKWASDLPHTYAPNWREVWNKARPQKEAAFIWLVYYKAMAVNY